VAQNKSLAFYLEMNLLGVIVIFSHVCDAFGILVSKPPASSSFMTTPPLSAGGQSLCAGSHALAIPQTWSQGSHDRQVDVFVGGAGGRVIIGLHGAGGSANPQDWRKYVSGANYIVAAPTGHLKGWNCGRESTKAPDVAFIEAIVDTLAGYANADISAGVTVIGNSNGCAMIIRLLAESNRSELSRFACLNSMLNHDDHDGHHFQNLDGNIASPLSTNRKVWFFHGESDPIIPFQGGNGVLGYNFWGGVKSSQLVAELYGVEGSSSTEHFGETTVITYGSSQVLMWSVAGEGHGCCHGIASKIMQLVNSEDLTATRPSLAGACTTLTRPRLHAECWNQGRCKDDGAELCNWCGTHDGSAMYCCRKDWLQNYPEGHNCHDAIFPSHQIKHHICTPSAATTTTTTGFPSTSASTTSILTEPSTRTTTTEAPMAVEIVWEAKTYVPMNISMFEEVVFTYKKWHNVARFENDAAFKNCDFNHASIVGRNEDGSYTFTPGTQGTYYFGCSVSRHCSSMGQKIAIRVSTPTVTDSTTSADLTTAVTTAPLTRSTSLMPVSSTTTSPVMSEYLVADIAVACSQLGFEDVQEPSCQAACNSQGFTNFKSGWWTHSPGCFASVAGPYQGNCHWNANAGADTYKGERTRALCLNPITTRNTTATATTASTSSETIMGTTSTMTTESTTKLIATTKAPSTTAMTTAPTTSMTAEGFSSVHGSNRACRGASASDNSAAYYDLFVDKEDLEDCKAQCIGTRGCVGIEFHRRGRCEVWKRPEGIVATAKVIGYECFRYTSEAAGTTRTTTAVPGFAAADGGEHRVCRGATSTDNSAKYYQLFTGIPNLESCKALCVGKVGCVGVEFQDGGRCEVWTRPEGIGATAGASGYRCLRYEPLSLLRNGAKLRGATRKSPYTLDAMGTSYFQANTTLSKVQPQQAGEICQENVL